MATALLPRPTLWQGTKKLIDQMLGTAGRALSKPLVVEEIETEPAPISIRLPLPVNAATLPSAFLNGFAEIYAGIQPNFRRVVHRLRHAQVLWHGSVVKGLRVFLPSLPQPWMELELAGSFLLRQFKSCKVNKIAAQPVGLVFDSWYENYFHWMAEVLARLALLRKVQPECALLLPGPNPSEYITRTFSTLDSAHTYALAPGELVVVPDLLVPIRLGRIGYMLPELVRTVREAGWSN